MPFCHVCKLNVRGYLPHTCPPMWRCWCPADEDGPDMESFGGLVAAHDQEHAADQYVRDFDELKDGDTFTVLVRLESGGPVHRMTVTVEMTVSLDVRQEPT